MTEAIHTLRVTFCDDTVRYEVICPHDGTEGERPCGVWMDKDWPDATTCACTTADCACREGFHDECSDGDHEGYIADLGPACRLERIDQCWYVHAVEELGNEMLEMTPFSIDIPVHLSGGSWEDPIAVESARRAPSLVPRVNAVA